MKLSVILFAAAALVACLATAINAASPEEILVPFNDLLPPLLAETPALPTEGAGAEAETGFAVANPEAIFNPVVVSEPLQEVLTTVVEGSSEAASNEATSIALPAPVAPPVAKAPIKQIKPEKKPLKKSYYQQQQQLKHNEYQHQQVRTGGRPPKGVLPTLTPFPRHLKKIFPADV